MNDDIVRAVAQRIARYLQDNPDAADTVEGVHHVWIGDPALASSLDITQAALEWLLASGRIACVRVAHRQLWRRRADDARP
ncbi:hypothetical protein [Paraburkholderia humisilvae]|uniref:hypothetical protein n=1 Tax=Paraburkholderia humisilvae TaxID=627669 RepID=UPI0015822D5F|nr:hypothetical protein [Paraburkholderia humisilvae]